MGRMTGVGDAEKDPALERAMHYIYEHVNQFYNFKGLHEFKEKYRPDWSPRYLIFPGYASLPSVGLVLQSAMTGESFVLDSVKEYWTVRRQQTQAKASISHPAPPPSDS